MNNIAKRRLITWATFLVAFVVIFGVFILSPVTHSGEFVAFTAREGSWIEARGSDTYHIVGSGVGYFRITSGAEFIDGTPITGNNFSGEGDLTGSTWKVIDSTGTDFEVTSPVTVEITVHHGASDQLLYILVAIFSVIVLFLLGVYLVS